MTLLLRPSSLFIVENILFWQLAKKLHPDTNKDDPDAEKKFQEVSKAYEVISIHFYLSGFCINVHINTIRVFKISMTLISGFKR